MNTKKKKKENQTNHLQQHTRHTETLNEIQYKI